MIEPALDQLWQFETWDTNMQNLRVFLMHFIVEPVFRLMRLCRLSIGS